LANLPRHLRPAGLRIADALLDTPLREATGTPLPPWWARQLLACGLAGRAMLLRHASRPRADPHPGPSARTYPDGYERQGPPTGDALVFASKAGTPPLASQLGLLGYRVTLEPATPA
jgi:hypothetical protein